MKNSTLIKTFSLAAMFAVATVASAQAPVQKASPNALIPNRVVTPVKSHAALKSVGVTTSGFAKAPKKVQSQQSELINEDFSNFTSGTEDAPDTVNWVANTWQGTGNDIDASLTHNSGWIGNFIAQAGGAAGMRAPGAAYQTGSYLATPAQDYSGTVTITFRAKRWPGYKGNINITTYVADDNGDGYGDDEGSVGSFRIFGNDEGWQYYTQTFDWHSSDPTNRIWFFTYDQIIIDDINIKVSADNFVAEPTVKDVTNVTDSTFTINWEPVRAANTYLIGLKKKVFTSDEDCVSYYYDFEDGQIPEGFEGNATIVDGVGQNGSKAIAVANNDTITLPANNATYKAAKLYMGVVGPENASAADLQSSEIYLYFKRGEEWTSQGYFRASNFLDTLFNENLLYSYWYGNEADTYNGIRFVPVDFPDGYKLVLDSIALTTNRPFDYEVIAEPEQWYSYGENYNYQTDEGFVDWHVSSNITNPNYSYTVSAAKLKQIDIEYDPSAEYYYSLIARRYTTNSTYTWHHVFALPAAVATGAENKDERGSYTATWTGPVKATRYAVTSYGVYVAQEDEENHPIIDEDFSLIDNTVTTATDPTSPESLGNDYEEVSFNGYTQLPGWSGLSTTLAQGYIGCADGYYYVPFIYTPYLQADNDDNLTLDIKAVGTAGDYLTLSFEGGDTYAVAFDADGNIDVEGTVPVRLKSTTVRIASANYAAFMLDEFAVKQNIKKGCAVNTPLETVYVDADATTDTLSYTFTGLEGYDYYAYDVIALQDLDGETASAEPSNRPTFSLVEGVDDPEIVDGIVSVASANNNIVKVVARYGLDGRQVSANTKGLQILKLSDGRTIKTVVK